MRLQHGRLLLCSAVKSPDAAAFLGFQRPGIGESSNGLLHGARHAVPNERGPCHDVATGVLGYSDAIADLDEPVEFAHDAAHAATSPPSTISYVAYVAYVSVLCRAPNPNTHSSLGVSWKPGELSQEQFARTQ